VFRAIGLSNLICGDLKLLSFCVQRAIRAIKEQFFFEIALYFLKKSEKKPLFYYQKAYFQI
jgi:hypothetical protein